MDLPLPDDAVLATLVQDIEIKRERLSATRYVGDFTVRFREGVRQFIPVTQSPAPGDTLMLDMQATATPGVPFTPPSGRVVLNSPVLLLPYYQSISGQMVLWGEPNPWRAVWQNRPPRPSTVVPPAEVKAAEGKIIVPLGDIGDISAGADAGVWSGDYSALTKMQQNYGVETIILAVANRSGIQMTVDLYSFQSGGLTRRGQVRPILDPALDDAAAYAAAAEMTMREILTVPATQNTAAGIDREQSLLNVSRDLLGGTLPRLDNQAGVDSQAEPMSGPGARVPAAMQFDDFMTWMETQKRLADIVPTVQVDIQTISRNYARFTLGFDGDVSTLTAVLAEKGLRLSQAGAADYTLTLVQ